MTVRAATGEHAAPGARSGGLGATARALVVSLRPRQWPKNAVVLVGLVFARELGQPEQVLRAVLGAFLFCLLSGAVYLVNDLLDVEKDRRHPLKRNRPLASGQLSPSPPASSPSCSSPARSPPPTSSPPPSAPSPWATSACRPSTSAGSSTWSSWT